jgi:hypothetical protein
MTTDLLSVSLSLGYENSGADNTGKAVSCRHRLLVDVAICEEVIQCLRISCIKSSQLDRDQVM